MLPLLANCTPRVRIGSNPGGAWIDIGVVVAWLKPCPSRVAGWGVRATTRAFLLRQLLQAVECVWVCAQDDSCLVVGSGGVLGSHVSKATRRGAPFVCSSAGKAEVIVRMCLRPAGPESRCELLRHG